VEFAEKVTLSPPLSVVHDVEEYSVKARSANVTRYQKFQPGISTALCVGKFGLRTSFKERMSDG
jgi:hypothetical protein